MKALYQAQRYKGLTTDELFTTVHVADNYNTLCGKELDQLWHVRYGVDISVVTCKECAKQFKLLCETH